MRFVGHVPAELLGRAAQSRLLNEAKQKIGAEVVAQACIDGRTRELALKIALLNKEWKP